MIDASVNQRVSTRHALRHADKFVRRRGQAKVK
jgi:hypothetical protein